MFSFFAQSRCLSLFPAKAPSFGKREDILSFPFYPYFCSFFQAIPRTARIVMTLVPTAESDELVRQSNLSHPRSPTHISANSPHGTNPARSLDDGESKDPSVMSSKRRLPLWVKEQLPGWGERFCLPEWDDDDDFFEGDELLNDKSEMNNEYRGNNGWKVRFIYIR